MHFASLEKQLLDIDLRQIMWEINKSISDLERTTGRSSIRLNCDRDLSPYHIKYPVTWAGYLNSHPITIIQPGQSSSSISDFDFIVYPQGFDAIKGDIIDIIDDKLHKLLD